MLVRLLSNENYGIYSAVMQFVSMLTLVTFSPIALLALNLYNRSKYFSYYLKNIFLVGLALFALVISFCALTGVMNNTALLLYASGYFLSLNAYQFALSLRSVNRSVSKSLHVSIVFGTALALAVASRHFLYDQVTVEFVLLLLVILQTVCYILMYDSPFTLKRVSYFCNKSYTYRKFLFGQVFISFLNWGAFQMPKLAMIPIFGIDEYGNFMKTAFLPIMIIGGIETVLHSVFIPKFFRENVKIDLEKYDDFIIFIKLMIILGGCSVYWVSLFSHYLLELRDESMVIMAVCFGIEIIRSIVNYLIVVGYRYDQPQKYWNVFVWVISVSFISIMFSDNISSYVVMLFFAMLLVVSINITRLDIYNENKLVAFLIIPILVSPLFASASFMMSSSLLVAIIISLYYIAIVIKFQLIHKMLSYINFN